LVKRHPKLIAEVLSASTAQIDTAEKLDEYQTIPELEEYVLIDSRRRSIRIYRRKGALFETAPVYTAGHVDLARSPLRSMRFTRTFLSNSGCGVLQ
jgi:Uma2 family endonuclease